MRLLLLSVLLTGCSTQAWYQGIQQSAAMDCNRQPADARERCLARINKESYDDYRKARPE